MSEEKSPLSPIGEKSERERRAARRDEVREIMERYDRSRDRRVTGVYPQERITQERRFRDSVSPSREGIVSNSDVKQNGSAETQRKHVSFVSERQNSNVGTTFLDEYETQDVTGSMNVDDGIEELDRQLQRLRESNSKVLTSTRYDSYSENIRKKDTVKDHDVKRHNVKNEHTEGVDIVRKKHNVVNTTYNDEKQVKTPENIPTTDSERKYDFQRQSDLKNGDHYGIDSK